MDSMAYLTRKLEKIENSLKECDASICNVEGEIKKGWELVKLQDRHPLISQYANATKSQYPRIR